MTDAEAWLKANRCPYCEKHNRAACSYTVRECSGGDGFKCYGYRSRYWDEGWPKAVAR